MIGYAQGFFGNDTVRFGNKGTKQLVVNATRFGQADEIADAFTDVKKVTAGSFSSTVGWQVISSTGSTFIYAPRAIAAEIAKAANAEVNSPELFCL
ncbi:hypothetical protein ANCDUO_00907 [Ancylostoma duodenale]|uniref:Peptidase A1 domain-containing protein n=1 Tax=Ancylostoma duodenale TaxID=51022 RepID=A0A0C2HAU9_9BILA|nr:hypothetical protein ANCDUO_00907 [Ancylostoma duodenale]